MHPAKSVIFFTTASGAGYGMLVWLAVFAARGQLPPDRGFGVVAFGLAFALVVAGLLSSTFHLGHPERAWRAMSQWRTSWLSREGLSAVLTFIPTVLFAAHWLLLQTFSERLAMVGLSGAAMSLVTVYCTGMIYQSLKPIPAWSSPWTTPAYLVLSLASGALLLTVLAGLFGLGLAASMGGVAVLLLLLGLAVKLLQWRHLDTAPETSSAASATGLGGGTTERVRLVAAPHTEDNYLLKEMGFHIARKHATKLRRIAAGLGFAAPAALIVGGLAVGAGSVGAAVLFVLAAASGTMGIVAERWLVFAEAKHVVTLYYGEEAV